MNAERSGRRELGRRFMQTLQLHLFFFHARICARSSAVPTTPAIGAPGARRSVRRARRDAITGQDTDQVALGVREHVYLEGVVQPVGAEDPCAAETLRARESLSTSAIAT
jgi:hypothetical protein